MTHGYAVGPEDLSDLKREVLLGVSSHKGRVFRMGHCNEREGTEWGGGLYFSRS